MPCRAPRSAAVKLGVLCLALVAAPAAADDAGEAPVVEIAPPESLTGRQIYERVVANRFRSFAQESVLISADRTGRAQESRFQMKWQDFRENGDDGERDVISKTLVRYTHPFDLRHAGYLILANQKRANDQFVYYPSKRRVVRVSLRSEAVYGTDFSFEDVVPREAEDFHHERLPNTALSGVDCWVVDLTPKEFAESEYSRIRVYVDKQRSVVVHARYWDRAGVEVKQMLAPPEKIEEHDGVFVPMESVMKNLLLESQTRLRVLDLRPNPELPVDTWNLRRLESH